MIIYLLICLVCIFRPGWILKLRAGFSGLIDQGEPCRALQILKKMNQRGLWSLLIILFLTLICYRGISVPDFSNYETAYSRMKLGIPYSYLGTGWYLLMNAGFTLGLTYAQVKAGIALISMLLVNSTLNHYCRSFRGRMFFWGICMIFPVLLDLTQIRFYLAAALVIFALRFLERWNFKNLLSYLLFVSAASFIHSSALIYLSFIAVYLFYLIPKTFGVLCLAGSLSLLLLKDQIIQIAVSLIKSDRLERYFLSGDPVGKLGLIFMTVFCAAILVLLWLGLKKTQANSENRPVSASVFPQVSSRENQVLGLASGMNLILLFVIPLCRLDANFFRLERIGWIIFVITAASFLFGKNPIRIRGTFRKLLLLSVFVLAAAANLYLISVFTFPLVAGYLL